MRACAGESPIYKMSRLKYLGCYRFTEAGQSIPSEIGLLTALTEIDFYYSNVGGAIPTEILKLSALQGMWLWGSNFVFPPGSRRARASLLLPTLRRAAFWTTLNLYYLGLGATGAPGFMPTEIAQFRNLDSLLVAGDAMQPRWSVISAMSQQLEYLGLFDITAPSLLASEIGRLSSFV